MSPTLSLILCFLTFICGQLFNAYCTSIHHIKIESVVTVVPVDAGFSLKTLVAIVLSVLIVHDLVLLLVLRHVYRTAKYQPKISLKTLLGPAAVATASSARHTEPRLLLLPPTPPNVPPVMSNGFRLPRLASTVPRAFWVWRVAIPGRPKLLLLLPPVPLHSPQPARIAFKLPRIVFSVPRPFWRWRAPYYRPPITASVPRAVLPLIESPAALALVTKRVSNQLPFVSLITGGRTRIHDFKLSFDRVRPPSNSNPATKLSASAVLASRRIKRKTQDTCVGSQPEEDLKLDAHALVFLASGRHFPVPLLRHVAVAALVRRLQLKVHDEPSYASIEEVAEDVGKAEAVEKTANTAEEVKKVGAAKKGVQENQVEKVVAAVEAAEDITQTVIVAEISSPTSYEEKEKIEVEKKVELDHSAVDKIEAVGEAAKVVKENEAAVTQNAVAIISPARSEEKVKVVAEDNSDTPPYEYLNDLPSYEEFVNGAPPEPLFEQRSFEVDYAVRRPPPLACWRSRIGATPRNCRVSQHHLLARLSLRVATSGAESTRV
ncbi:hypothetical protein DFH08DRAFT_928990 [Mycena albidolilacea]|uniref:Uncharacterized protein n=1 Tax=Mycena albidolilacea TaxID=1033008 RepID=A0AAD7AVX4_9AGAR|nr:hypothetical protein DFH08DRAFT_928990 [Mycena albidolilacea]